jgi:hypothetical protein
MQIHHSKGDRRWYNISEEESEMILAYQPVSAIAEKERNRQK